MYQIGELKINIFPLLIYIQKFDIMYMSNDKLHLN